MKVHTGLERLEDGSPTKKPLQMSGASFIYSSIHSFRDLMSAYCVTETVHSSGDIAMNLAAPPHNLKTKTALMQLTFSSGDRQ